MTGADRQRPRRVAVLVKRFPRLSETFILGEFLELRRQGLAVDLYAVANPGEQRVHPEALALMGEVTYLRSGRLLETVAAVLRTVRRHPWGTARAVGWTLTRHSRAALRNCMHAMVLVDRLADREPVHLHAHFLHSTAAIAFIARKLSGQRYSLTGHAKDIYTTLPENLMMRCRDAEFVTTCTEANERYLVDEIGLPSARVHVCRHGIDLDRFVSDRTGVQPGRILSIGRLVPKKGFDVLIRACGELRRGGVPFELRILGAGEMRDRLLALAEAEGVGDLISLPGSVSREEVVRELAAAEVFALSPVVMPDGDRDGVPNVILEAMASGVPVVASAISGIPEVLSEGVNARLVAPGEPTLLADVLADLLSDQAQRATLADAAQRLVSDRFGWSSAIEPLQALMLAMLEPAAEPQRLVGERAPAAATA